MSSKVKLYRILAIFFSIIIIVSILPLDVNENAQGGKYGDITPTSHELALLKKINENRTQNGVNPVILNATLTWAAKAHSQDMIENDFFNHTSSQEGQFNGATFNERVNDHAEYESGYVGECIAWNSWGIDVEWTMAAWKGSPPHWDIIINPNFREVGIGLLEGEWDGYSNAGLHTVDFGGPSVTVDLAYDTPLQFEPQSPFEGEDVTITATIQNIGNSDAYQVNVRFYDGDPQSGGVQIGGKDVPHILVHGESVEVSISWNTLGESGINNIYVIIDEDNIIAETNENNNEDFDSLTISPPDSSVHLIYGWNLISFPQMVAQEDIDTVLNSINRQYDIVQYYDSSDELDPWKNYHIQKTPYMNDLPSLNNKMGILIHVIDSQGAALIVDGEMPTNSQTIYLKAGWNLVGYPSNTSKSRDSALNNLEFGNHIDAIQYCDAQNGLYMDLQDSDFMRIGSGYFIHAKMDCEWIVNN